MLVGLGNKGLKLKKNIYEITVDSKNNGKRN